VADTLKLEVVTPARRVLESRANEVRIPGVEGELGVLPGHTPLLTSLGTGHVRFSDGGTSGQLVVQGGFAEVQPDAVTVLATIAETVEEIDVDAARVQLEEAQEALKTASADEFDDLSAKARLAEARLEAAAGGSA
jgi:F-type H+-transporting ATPase subunit epsilon